MKRFEERNNGVAPSHAYSFAFLRIIMATERERGGWRGGDDGGEKSEGKKSNGSVKLLNILFDPSASASGGDKLPKKVSAARCVGI